jgi:hypothetical protein
MCLFLTAQVSYAVSQNAKPTIDQTEQWIAEKISEYAYVSEGVYNIYELKFPIYVTGVRSGLLQWVYRSPGVYSEQRSWGTINISDISKISFRKYQHNVWLTIHLKPGFDRTTNSPNVIENNASADFILSNEILKNDMINRLNKAFSDLVKYYGGVFQISGDVY